MSFQKDGAPFDIYALHIIGDVQYPVGWFFDQANRDAIGVTEIPDAPTPAPVPPKVTRRQARQALLLTNGADGVPLLDKVQSVINSLDDGTAAGATKKGMAQIEWDDSQDFERSRPLLVEMAYALGLSDSQLDDLFTLAATL